MKIKLSSDVDTSIQSSASGIQETITKIADNLNVENGVLILGKVAMEDQLQSFKLHIKSGFIYFRYVT